MYLKLDDGNGGILLNLGTGGLSLQAVAKLNPEQDLILHFKFFDTGEKITVAGRVAWLGPTRKEAGICFKDLSDPIEQSIAGWIARQETSSHATEWKVASPVNVVPAASEILLPLPQVSIPSIPAGGTALDPQTRPSTALPSESHVGDTLPDPASSKPSTPPAFGTSFPASTATNALHAKGAQLHPGRNQPKWPQNRYIGEIGCRPICRCRFPQLTPPPAIIGTRSFDGSRTIHGRRSLRGSRLCRCCLLRKASGVTKC